MPKVSRLNSSKSRRLTRSNASAIVDNVLAIENKIQNYKEGIQQIDADIAEDMQKIPYIMDLLHNLSRKASGVSHLAEKIKSEMKELIYGEFIEEWLYEVLLDACDVGRWYSRIVPEVREKLTKIHGDDICRMNAAIHTAEKDLSRARHRAYKAGL